MAGRAAEGAVGRASARSAATASTAAAASAPSSTSSRSRRTPRSRPASRPTTPPTTPPGSSEARLAFEWFLGGNDLGLDLYDAKSGGCCDGLQEDRVNLNQGAESTLAFLLSLGEMKLVESTPAALRQAQVT